jgi:hypothetical protein
LQGILHGRSREYRPQDIRDGCKFGEDVLDV